MEPGESQGVRPEDEQDLEEREVWIPTPADKVVALLTCLHRDADDLVELLDCYGMDSATILDVLRRGTRIVNSVRRMRCPLKI